MPLWIVQEAKAAGLFGTSGSGRVDVIELEQWIKQRRGMRCPIAVFAYLREEWETKVKPTLPRKIGMADSIEEAALKTGMCVSMILRYLRDAKLKAFIE